MTVRWPEIQDWDLKCGQKSKIVGRTGSHTTTILTFKCSCLTIVFHLECIYNPGICRLYKGSILGHPKLELFHEIYSKTGQIVSCFSNWGQQYKSFSIQQHLLLLAYLSIHDGLLSDKLTVLYQIHWSIFREFWANIQVLVDEWMTQAK